ncbi:MAG: winged helix-turn-helix transcriptional regulator [Oceanospirillaceae bacterium]|nr:winged helix-turn-helix transcriptional regulator [Oceanospirillaceae bacterium]
MLKDPSDCTMCTLDHLRKATRAVALITDAALAPVQLKSTQFSLLVTLDKCGDIALGQLAKVLVMERTTLTRNIKPLIAKGLVIRKIEQDKRLRILSITEQGKLALQMAQPLWREAQLNLVEKFGTGRWSDLLDDLNFLTKEAQKL